MCRNRPYNFVSESKDKDSEPVNAGGRVSPGLGEQDAKEVFGFARKSIRDRDERFSGE